jgi:hypothetical protein
MVLLLWVVQRRIVVERSKVEEVDGLPGQLDMVDTAMSLGSEILAAQRIVLLEAVEAFGKFLNPCTDIVVFPVTIERRLSAVRDCLREAALLFPYEATAVEDRTPDGKWAV